MTQLTVTRRTFLRTLAATVGTLAVPRVWAMESGRMVRVGVIGLGRRGTRHLRSFQRLADVRIAALCDPVETRCRTAASTLITPPPARFGESSRLLDSAAIDAVSVASPPDTHLAIVTRALESGRHVFLESPTVRSLADASILIQAADRANVVSTDSLHAHALESVYALLQQLERGAIGSIHTAELFCGPLPLSLTMHGTVTTEAAGGAGAIEGFEMLDLARRALEVGLPSRVQTVADGSPEGFLRAELWFEDEQGATKSLRIHRSKHQDVGLRFHGDRGTFRLAPFGPPTLSSAAEEGSIPSVSTFVAAIIRPSPHLHVGTIADGAITGAVLQTVHVASLLKRPIALDSAGHAVLDHRATELLWS